MKKMNQKKRTRAGTIALYVLAVLLLCYGVYMMYSAYDYVNQYYSYQGTDITSNLSEAVQYIFSQSYLYLGFALIFYVLGVMLQKLNDLTLFLLPQEQSEPTAKETNEPQIGEPDTDDGSSVTEMVEPQRADADEKSETAAETDGAQAGEPDTEEDPGSAAETNEPQETVAVNEQSEAAAEKEAETNE